MNVESKIKLARLIAKGLDPTELVTCPDCRDQYGTRDKCSRCGAHGCIEAQSLADKEIEAICLVCTGDGKSHIRPRQRQTDCDGCGGEGYFL